MDAEPPGYLQRFATGCPYCGRDESGGWVIAEATYQQAPMLYTVCSECLTVDGRLTVIAEVYALQTRYYVNLAAPFHAAYQASIIGLVIMAPFWPLVYSPPAKYRLTL